ncbi:MAG: carbon storage regulator [Legionella sp.]|nr:carbon storage regulator [Legionella sp.]
MITCTSKVGQTLVIDDGLQLMLLGVRDDHVLLGFDNCHKIMICRKNPQNISEQRIADKVNK